MSQWNNNQDVHQGRENGQQGNAGTDPYASNGSGGGGLFGAQSGGPPQRDSGYSEDGYNTKGQDVTSAGKRRDDSEYGGYRGARFQTPDGQWHVDWSQSGRADDEKYYQGMGAAAANRQAYQVDFGQANEDRQRALQARQMQGDAADIYRRTAMGEQSKAQILGGQMLNNAQLQQQGAAVSGEGNGMAQAAMLRNQQNSQGAFTLHGAQALEAQKADEMARAREGWMQAQTMQRQDDLSGQNLAAQQAQIQGQSETGQRQLNDQGQLWGEQQAFNVNAASQQGGLAKMGLNTTRSAQDAAQATADSAHSYVYGKAAVSALGTGIGVAGSDERMKQRATSLAGAFAARRR